MFGEAPVKTSLEVGFSEGGLPPKLVRFCGRDHRRVPAAEEIPYEDSQFEVVMLAAAAVNAAAVREAHRVLRPEGRLFFIVPEKTGQQEGFTMPDVYSLVREGFDIAGVVRPPWWTFGLKGHTLFITARKKSWHAYKGLGCRNPYLHSLFTTGK